MTIRIPPDFQIPPRYILETDFDSDPPYRLLRRLSDRETVPVALDAGATMTNALLDELFTAEAGDAADSNNNNGDSALC